MKQRFNSSFEEHKQLKRDYLCIMAPPKTQATIIIGVLFDTRWNMTLDKEIVQQE